MAYKAYKSFRQLRPGIKFYFRVDCNFEDYYMQEQFLKKLFKVNLNESVLNGPFYVLSDWSIKLAFLLGRLYFFLIDFFSLF